MAALNRRHFSEGGSVDPREIFPSMYKRNLRQEKYVEKILMRLCRANLPGKCNQTDNSVSGPRGRGFFVLMEVYAASIRQWQLLERTPLEIIHMWKSGAREVSPVLKAAEIRNHFAIS